MPQSTLDIKQKLDPTVPLQTMQRVQTAKELLDKCQELLKKSDHITREDKTYKEHWLTLKQQMYLNLELDYDEESRFFNCYETNSEIRTAFKRWYAKEILEETCFYRKLELLKYYFENIDTHSHIHSYETPVLLTLSHLTLQTIKDENVIQYLTLQRFYALHFNKPIIFLSECIESYKDYVRRERDWYPSQFSLGTESEAADDSSREWDPAQFSSNLDREAREAMYELSKEVQNSSPNGDHDTAEEPEQKPGDEENLALFISGVISQQKTKEMQFLLESSQLEQKGESKETIKDFHDLHEATLNEAVISNIIEISRRLGSIKCDTTINDLFTAYDMALRELRNIKKDPSTTACIADYLISIIETLKKQLIEKAEMLAERRKETESGLTAEAVLAEYCRDPSRAANVLTAESWEENLLLIEEILSEDNLLVKATERKLEKNFQMYSTLHGMLSDLEEIEKRHPLLADIKFHETQITIQATRLAELRGDSSTSDEVLTAFYQQAKNTDNVLTAESWSDNLLLTTQLFLTVKFEAYDAALSKLESIIEDPSAIAHLDDYPVTRIKALQKQLVKTATMLAAQRGKAEPGLTAEVVLSECCRDVRRADSVLTEEPWQKNLLLIEEILSEDNLLVKATERKLEKNFQMYSTLHGMLSDLEEIEKRHPLLADIKFHETQITIQATRLAELKRDGSTADEVLTAFYQQAKNTDNVLTAESWSDNLLLTTQLFLTVKFEAYDAALSKLESIIEDPSAIAHLDDYPVTRIKALQKQLVKTATMLAAQRGKAEPGLTAEVVLSECCRDVRKADSVLTEEPWQKNLLLIEEILSEDNLLVKATERKLEKNFQMYSTLLEELSKDTEIKKCYTLSIQIKFHEEQIEMQARRLVELKGEDGCTVDVLLNAFCQKALKTQYHLFHLENEFEAYDGLICKIDNILKQNNENNDNLLQLAKAASEKEKSLDYHATRLAILRGGNSTPDTELTRVCQHSQQLKKVKILNLGDWSQNRKKALLILSKATQNAQASDDQLITCMPGHIDDSEVAVTLYQQLWAEAHIFTFFYVYLHMAVALRSVYVESNLAKINEGSGNTHTPSPVITVF